MDNKGRLRIHLLLLGLVILDIGLSVVALLFPSLWFQIFHHAPYEDPQGLLRRTGAVWVAFTLLQFIALVRWTRHPHWLVLIAGVRLTELFSDWTYLLFCTSITGAGRLGLLVAPPGESPVCLASHARVEAHAGQRRTAGVSSAHVRCAAAVMIPTSGRDGSELLERIYRQESGRILATLIRLLGDFDRAEEALHEAMRVALEEWPTSGVPDNPVSWLISTGRFKGIDGLRKHARADASLDSLQAMPGADAAEPVQAMTDGAVPDDQLRLIFICCHPALPADARAALTLREVCGLTTEEIARAFLSTPPAIAQRIVRAKNKIRDDRLPYEVPAPSELAARLGSVLQVIYLVFNEGYSASAGDSVARPDLSGEAIRLGRIVRTLLPDPEVKGLLALMLLQESRRKARATEDGEIVLLDDQDRSLWDRDLMAEGIALLEDATIERMGPYANQAAIAAVHAKAVAFADTDWREMVALYDVLLRTQPSPVVQLNRAVAVAMRDGPEAGLVHIDEIQRGGKLDDYPFLHSARAELCRRLGRLDEAKACYDLALARTRQAPERRFLERRRLALG